MKGTVKFYLLGKNNDIHNILNMGKDSRMIFSALKNHYVIVRIVQSDDIYEIKAHNLTTFNEAKIYFGHQKVLIGTYKDSFGNIQKSALATPGGVQMNYKKLPKFNEILNPTREEIKLVEEAIKSGIFEGNNQLEIFLCENLSDELRGARRVLKEFRFTKNSEERQSLENIPFMGGPDKQTSLDNLENLREAVTKMISKSEGTKLSEYGKVLMNQYKHVKPHLEKISSDAWKNTQSTLLVTKEIAEKNTKYMQDTHIEKKIVIIKKSEKNIDDLD